MNLSDPTHEDIERLTKQWLKACELVEHHVGEVLDQSERDLDRLQELLDRAVLDPSQTWELQCLGIALGRVLVKNTPSLDWAMVDDEYGRDPTIRLRGTEAIYNVLTMISKRVEKRDEVDVRALYEFVRDHAKSQDLKS